MIMPDVPSCENLLVSRAMKTSDAAKLDQGVDPLTAADGFGGFLSTIFVVAAAGAVVFGLMSSGSGEPLVLTLIAVLAMLGLFLLLAIAAGHVRIGARLPTGELLRAAADRAQDPVMITGASGEALYWNPAFDVAFGRTDAGPYAALESAVRPDTDAAQALFRLMRAAERGEARGEDLRLKSGGRDRVLRASVRTFSGPAVGAAGVSAPRLAYWHISDVTADAAREAQRVGVLEQALASFEAMPAGFVAVAADGVIVHVNAAFEAWLGYPRGGLRARPTRLADLAGEEGARQLALLAADPTEDRRAVDLDLTRRSDGRIVPLTLFVEPSGGGFTLTAINRAGFGASAAGARDTRLAPFFQSAPFGIATLDGEGRIASCNTAFVRMVLDGRPAHEAPALDALCLTAEPDERNAVSAGLVEVLAGRGGVLPIEITAGAQKQHTRRVYLAPIVSRAGGEAAAVYVVDATDQKALEARYAQAQKMEAVGKLAGGIAHDFNNVLTAIIGFSDLLLQTHRPSDPAYKDIRNIQSAANRAAGLVANLLGFSRKQTQQVSVLNLGEVTADLAPILKTAVGEKVDLKIQSERDLWYVRADSNQIFNVILNLVRNARDAMAGGGALTIKTRNVTERESQKMTGRGRVYDRRIRADRSLRHGQRHERRGHGENLRAVLHDQGRRQGDRPRALVRLRHCQAVGRLHSARKRDRQGDHVQGLSAAPCA